MAFGRWYSSLLCALLAACASSAPHSPPPAACAGRGCGGEGGTLADSVGGAAGDADGGDAAGATGMCYVRGTETPCCLAEIWNPCTGFGSCLQGSANSYATYCYENGITKWWQDGPGMEFTGFAARDGRICYSFTGGKQDDPQEQTYFGADGTPVAHVWIADDTYDAQCLGGGERRTYALPPSPASNNCVAGACEPPE
jgi:hypothetical protein